MPDLTGLSESIRQRIRDSRTLRAWLNAHARLLIIPLLLLCLWGLHRSWQSLRGPVPVSFTIKLYFLDEDTGETLIKTERDIPPLLGKNGKPSVVQAIYMTATNCNDKTLVYLSKYTDDGKAAIEDEVRTRGSFDPRILMGHGHDLLVRSPAAGSPWVKADTPEGTAVLDSFVPPPNTPRKYCNPN